jgi:hypothetical protein
MLSKGIPAHLITAIQTTYMENIIRVNAGNEYLKILESLPRG